MSALGGKSNYWMMKEAEKRENGNGEHFMNPSPVEKGCIVGEVGDLRGVCALCALRRFLLGGGESHGVFVVSCWQSGEGREFLEVGVLGLKVCQSYVLLQASSRSMGA